MPLWMAPTQAYKSFFKTLLCVFNCEIKYNTIVLLNWNWHAGSFEFKNPNTRSFPHSFIYRMLTAISNSGLLFSCHLDGKLSRPFMWFPLETILIIFIEIDFGTTLCNLYVVMSYFTSNLWVQKCFAQLQFVL